jgi:alpha-glucosidase
LFGNIKNLENLIEEVRARDLKLRMSIVPNHTSNEHLWYQESLSPVKIQSATTITGPMLMKKELWQITGKMSYYYHAFLKVQPGLNQANPEV